MDSSSAVVSIAADGDVIFVVGQTKKQLRVNSVILSNASSYFKAMFGPHFSEGQNLDKSNPKVIPMPDDDAEVLTIICQVIHHQNDAVPDLPPPPQVLELAVAADKFACVLALKHAFSLWLNSKENASINSLTYLMDAAYILNNAQTFNDITRSLIFQHDESYLVLLEKVECFLDWMPVKALCLLEESRNQLRTELQQILFEGSFQAGFECGNSHCAWSSRYCLAYVNLLHSAGLNPKNVLKSSIATTIRRCDTLDEPSPPANSTPCSYRSHHEPNWRAERNSKLVYVKKRGGLCIDCVRSTTLFSPKACSARHRAHSMR